MRALTVLGVLQALGILVLVGHSFGNTRQVAEQPSPTRPAVRATPSAAGHADAAIAAADEQRLLQEIREELQRLQTQLHMQSGVATPTDTARPRNESASRDERDSVAQQIENYRGAGPITDAQMLELQAAIMRLDDGSRKQMMGRLMRAWKSGEIDGRL